VTLLGVIGMVSIDANPSLMTSAVRNLPAAFESRLGDAALNRVRADALDLDDDVIVAAVQEITQRLLFEVEDIPFDFRVAIVASSESDLILFPGGRMLLSLGLLEEVETPEEMAAILAHQIQHAIRRHPLILFERWLISAKSFDVWAVVFGYDPKAVASYVKSMSSMQFNRFQELEADIAAGDLLARVGVPPHTLAKFMRRCSEVSAAAGFCQHHSGIPTHGEDSDEDVGQPSQAFGDIDWSAVQRRVRLTTQ
jgi:predicted Zn-dependent protease